MKLDCSTMTIPADGGSLRRIFVQHKPGAQISIRTPLGWLRKLPLTREVYCDSNGRGKIEVGPFPKDFELPCRAVVYACDGNDVEKFYITVVKRILGR